ncbi:hypothetical protein D3C80_598570 [compost metagenome]
MLLDLGFLQLNGVPLLAALDEQHAPLKQKWLSRVAESRARLAVSEPGNPLVSDAHVADLLLLANGDEVHALEREAVRLTRNESVDPSRQLFQVEWTPTPATCVASGEQG